MWTIYIWPLSVALTLREAIWLLRFAHHWTSSHIGDYLCCAKVFKKTSQQFKTDRADPKVLRTDRRTEAFPNIPSPLCGCGLTIVIYIVQYWVHKFATIIIFHYLRVICYLYSTSILYVFTRKKLIY